MMILRSILAASLLTGAPIVDAKVSDLELVHRSINALVEQFGDGYSVGYREYRFIVFSKFPKHYQIDVAALFSIEGFDGGNMHSEYLAIYDFVESDELEPHKGKRLRLVAVSRVGGKYWRTLDYESMRIDGEQLLIPAKSWLPSDPGCCASKPISLRFQLDHGQLVELASAEN